MLFFFSFDIQWLNKSRSSFILNIVKREGLFQVHIPCPLSVSYMFSMSRNLSFLYPLGNSDACIHWLDFEKHWLTWWQLHFNLVFQIKGKDNYSWCLYYRKWTWEKRWTGSVGGNNSRTHQGIVWFEGNKLQEWGTCRCEIEGDNKEFHVLPSLFQLYVVKVEGRWRQKEDSVLCCLWL